MIRKLISLALIALASASVQISAQDAAGDAGKPTVYLVSNAHFDTQWRWTVQTSIDSYLYNTLVQNFALFEDYPDYIFNFEGAVKYAWAKEYYPDLYEKLKEYVKEGRWHVSGASWDATDPNMPSTESFIRNILQGQEFFQKEFGVKSTDIMLPDCFGFGWQLPSLAAHCGLIGFGTQKLAWRYHAFFDNGMKFPFYFGIWKGPDGNQLMAVMDGGVYIWSPGASIKDFEDINVRLADARVPAAYKYFGIGDRGGAIAPYSLNFVDDAVHNPGPAYNVKYATSDEMFKDYLWDSRLPVYDGELLMDTHATGNYTSKAQMKNLNRRNEHALIAAESISSLSELYGGADYPAYTIDEGWKRVILHQFHDDLTGTSLPECYQFSYNDEYITLRQMNSLIETGVNDVASVMDTDVKGIPVVVFNPVTSSNNDVVCMDVELPASCKYADVIAPDGKKVNSQLIRREDGSCSVLFAGTSPSLGLEVYDVRPSAGSKARPSALKVTESSIENKIYRVRLNKSGDIISIYDKRYKKEIVREGEAFGYAFFSNNKSDDWPSWEILKEVVDRTPDDMSVPARTSIEECGPLRAVLRVEKEYGGSTFVQRIILTDGACDDRIDVQNDVDWHSEASLLKASFPVSFDAPEAAYDLGMGNIKRGNNTETAYEVVAQQWADMTAADNSYGVTILNDSKYGWDKPNDHTLRLTLLHTPTADRDFAEQGTQDLGRHSFTYSIIGHRGILDPAAADIAADQLNKGKSAYAAAKHAGTAGKSISMISSSNPNLRVKAFKKAQDGDGYIVRVHELSGKGAKGQIAFCSDILSASEANGIEEKIGPASFSRKSLEVSADKFGIKTFRVRLNKPSSDIVNPEYVQLGLPFDIVAITTDSFRSLGNVGSNNDSFAAEIIPDNFSYRGIPFNFGRANYNNAVRCRGQVLSIPEGAKELHLLVAAMPADGKDSVSATFVAGDNTITRTISAYNGFYGHYGWPGYYESKLREDDVAYVGTHTHNYHTGNRSYEYTYAYLVSIPVSGVSQIRLPESDVVVFSATVNK